MKSTDDQGLIPVIVASEADSTYIRTIPTAQPAAGDGSVSLDLGLPPECATSVAAGGKRPEMKDMNGIWNLFSRAIQSLQAYRGVYDATFATAIGGYPKYAMVSDSSGNFWVSTADSNTTIPGADGAEWQSLFTGLQTALGFTPVQQGGGQNQATDKVNIGNSTDVAGVLQYSIGGVDGGPLISGLYGATTANGDAPIYGMYWSALGRAYAGHGADAASLTWTPIASYADVTSVQTNLTTAITNQANVNSSVAATLAQAVLTPADNTNAVNGRVTQFLYNKTLQQFVAFCPTIGVAGNGMALIGSQTFGVTGYETISNMVIRGSDGALQLNAGNISANALVDYLPSSTSSGGGFRTVVIGATRIISWTTTAYDGELISFPTAFSAAPEGLVVVADSASNTAANSVTCNVTESAKTQWNFRLHLAYFAGSVDNSVPSTAPLTIQVMAMGPA